LPPPKGARIARAKPSRDMDVAASAQANGDSSGSRYDERFAANLTDGDSIDKGLRPFRRRRLLPVLAWCGWPAGGRPGLGAKSLPGVAGKGRLGFRDAPASVR